MPSGIELSSGVVVGSPKSLDAKYGPYDTVALALADLTSSLRYQGLTVGIKSGGSIVEYWFKDGTADANFVEKVVAANWDTLLNKPSTFAPSSHTHPISEVTNLQTILDGKQPSGNYATLESGKVPASQLPSYVDDVLEFSSQATLPATGETGKIYVALDTNKIYRWSGSTYVEISSGTTGTTDWNALTNKPSTFPPSSHTHQISEVTGLETALEQKESRISFAAGGVTNADSVVPAGRNQIFTFESYNFSQNRSVTLPRSNDGAQPGDTLTFTHKAQFHVGGPWSVVLRQYEVVAPQGSPQYGTGFTNLITLADGETVELVAVGGGGNTPVTWTIKNLSTHTHPTATTTTSGFMSSSDKTKLDGIASGAEVNVNADWTATSGDAQILNKPTIPPTAVVDAELHLTSGGSPPFWPLIRLGPFSVYRVRISEPIELGVSLVGDQSEVGDIAQVILTRTSNVSATLNIAYADASGGVMPIGVIRPGHSVYFYNLTGDRFGWMPLQTPVDWNLPSSGNAFNSIANKPSTFPPSAHDHNDLYYTESETDTLLSSKQNALVRATVSSSTNQTVNLSESRNREVTVNNYSNTLTLVLPRMENANSTHDNAKDGDRYVFRSGTLTGGSTTLVTAYTWTGSGYQNTTSTLLTLTGGTWTFLLRSGAWVLESVQPHDHAIASTSTAGFMSSADKAKLDGVASGAEVNVNADWNATSGDAFILNKPTIPTITPNAGPSFIYRYGGTGTGQSFSNSGFVGPGNVTLSDSAANGSPVGGFGFYGGWDDLEYTRLWVNPKVLFPNHNRFRIYALTKATGQFGDGIWTMVRFLSPTNVQSTVPGLQAFGGLGNNSLGGNVAGGLYVGTSDLLVTDDYNFYTTFIAYFAAYNDGNGASIGQTQIHLQGVNI